MYLFFSHEFWWYWLPAYSPGQVELCSCKRLNAFISSAVPQLLWHHFPFSDIAQLGMGHPVSLRCDRHQLADRVIVKEGKCLKMVYLLVFLISKAKQNHGVLCHL